MSFAYIGQALTPKEFASYVSTYNFGTIPPSYLVIHHTYKPDASWAPISGDQSTWWDRNEAGLSNDQIRDKRKPQLDSIMAYYRDYHGWSAGPHLFVDERWIWLFTPMDTVGIHAASGNSYTDASGLHYSVGIEVVGYFENVGWPVTIQKNLQVAVQTLKARLKNFDIVYHEGPKNTPAAHDHSISFHRDYNKDACPGAVITPEYAIPILRTPFVHYYPRLVITAPCAVFTARSPDAPLAGGPDSGQTWLSPGDEVQVGDKRDGWYWISDRPDTDPGIGFIPVSYGRPA